jgi:hypothetical protein
MKTVIANDRVLGGVYVVAIMLAAVAAGPVVLFLLSEGRIMRGREVFTVVGPFHYWVASLVVIAIAAGVALGGQRVEALGKHLKSLESGRPGLTLGLWGCLIAVTVASTAFYGVHAL